MPRDALKVGVVGAGYFAKFHLDAWSRIDRVNLAALADSDTEKARAAAAAYGKPRIFPSLKEMLGAQRPNLIDIATPSPTHASLVRQAVDAGIPVICQKPFCASYDEAKAVVAYAGSRGVTLAIHENFRFEPWHRAAKAIIASGKLGEIYNITFRLRPGDGQGPNAYLARQPYFQTMPRFLMRETGIHFIDVFRFLVGDITGVMADLRRLNPAIKGEDAGLVIFHFADGARGIFDGNRLADHAADDRRLTMGEMWIDGSTAALRLDGFGRIHTRDHGTNTEIEHVIHWENRGYGGDCVKMCLEHMAHHLIDGASLENSGQDYLQNLAVEDAIYRSAVEQRYIALNP